MTYAKINVPRAHAAHPTDTKNPEINGAKHVAIIQIGPYTSNPAIMHWILANALNAHATRQRIAENTFIVSPFSGTALTQDQLSASDIQFCLCIIIIIIMHINAMIISQVLKCNNIKHQNIKAVLSRNATLIALRYHLIFHPIAKVRRPLISNILALSDSPTECI